MTDPVILAPQSSGSVADRISGVPLGRFGWRFLAGLGFSLAVVMMMLTSITWLLARGVGVWGIKIPVAWGFAITNFVWWIGIGHAGTLISAILLLMRQEWRTSINRLAEAMTLFAVANAGLFPLLHLGRIWKFYYLFPYPDTLGLYPQWRSPLVWDVIAVLTYGLVSLIFWYLGLVPDLATLRDRARRPLVRKLAGVLALGWRGAARHWRDYKMLYLLLAGLATPLVVSVHSIVSMDFSVAIVPGWHSTIFPPYFVAGAIYSGFAMVLTITIPLRRAFGLHDLITTRHIDLMAKVMLTSGLVVGYGYVMEFFNAWYSGDEFEKSMAVNRVTGGYWFAFALMMLGNVVAPQFCWFRAVRKSPVALWILSLVVNVGMWVERYVIVIQSLHRDYMPSAWGFYNGTVWDWTLFLGSLGFFTFLFLLFVRFVPMISVHEVNEFIHSHDVEGADRSPEPLEARGSMGPPPAESGSLDLPPPGAELHGVSAEFDTPAALREAAHRVHEAGYRRVEAYSPFPVEGLDEALQLRNSRVPRWVLGGGLLGASLFFGYACWTTMIHYPWNVGGRPDFSWPNYIPISWELGVLGASFIGLFAWLGLTRLPRLRHPIFAAPGFRRASRDRFFLCVEAADPRFDPQRTRDLLEAQDALNVAEVWA